MRNMEAIRADLAVAQNTYIGLRDGDVRGSEIRAANEAVKLLQDELSDAICAGAEPCPDCGAMPRGLRHIHCMIRNGVRTDMYVFEVGCIGCKDHRSVGPTREDAVANWNAGTYLPPKE